VTAPAQRAYDRLATVYDRRWARYTEDTLRAAVADLGPIGGLDVLDLAAGTGELSRRMLVTHPAPRRVVALDLSGAMLARARDKPGVRSALAAQGRADRLPLPDAAFDLVACANAFHHFDRPDVALAEALRVLRPGGRLLLIDWCDDYWMCKLCGVYLRLVDPSFVRAYGLGECQRRIAAAGFRVAAARRFKVDWLWGLMLLEAVRDDQGAAPGAGPAIR